MRSYQPTFRQPLPVLLVVSLAMIGLILATGCNRTGELSGASNAPDPVAEPASEPGPPPSDTHAIPFPRNSLECSSDGAAAITAWLDSLVKWRDGGALFDIPNLPAVEGPRLEEEALVLEIGTDKVQIDGRHISRPEILADDSEPLISALNSRVEEYQADPRHYGNEQAPLVLALAIQADVPGTQVQTVLAALTAHVPPGIDDVVFLFAAPWPDDLEPLPEELRRPRGSESDLDLGQKRTANNHAALENCQPIFDYASRIALISNWKAHRDHFAEAYLECDCNADLEHMMTEIMTPVGGGLVTVATYSRPQFLGPGEAVIEVEEGEFVEIAADKLWREIVPDVVAPSSSILSEIPAGKTADEATIGDDPSQFFDDED